MRGSSVTRIFGAIARFIGEGLLVIVGAPVLLVLYWFGMASDSPWIFHGTCALTLLFPAVLMGIYAVKGRSDKPGRRIGITNGLGTSILVLSSLVFITFYCIAIYNRITD